MSPNETNDLQPMIRLVPDYSNKRQPTREEKKLQSSIARNILKHTHECREEIRCLEKGYHNKLHQVLGYAFTIAAALRHDGKQYADFLQNPFFSEKEKIRVKSTDKKVLRNVLNFIFTAKTKHVKNRTGKYTAALLPLLIGGFPAHLVAETIEERKGIDRMYKETISQRKKVPRSIKDAGTSVRLYDEENGASPFTNLKIGEQRGDLALDHRREKNEYAIKFKPGLKREIKNLGSKKIAILTVTRPESKSKILIVTKVAIRNRN